MDSDVEDWRMGKGKQRQADGSHRRNIITVNGSAVVAKQKLVQGSWIGLI
jgi:hypothetical protein